MDAVMRILVGYQQSVILYNVVKLGIPEMLKDGPKSGEDVAELTKTKVDLTCRLMRAAAAIGVFDRNPSSLSYSLNSLSSCLLDGHGGMKWLALHSCEPATVKAYLNLEKTLVDGSDAYEAANKLPLFDYFQNNPESSERFNKGMSALNQHFNIPSLLPQFYSFSEAKHVVDVGGGMGSILVGILSAFPHVKGTIFDLPHVVEEAKQKNQFEGSLGSRISYAGGNFFETVAEGGDIYTLKAIIHDWPDEKAVEILKHVKKALPPHGKILLIEQVIKETGDEFGSLLDILMMVVCKSKERTEKEFTQIFTTAGLKLTKIISLVPSPFCVLECLANE